MDSTNLLAEAMDLALFEADFGTSVLPLLCPNPAYCVAKAASFDLNGLPLADVPPVHPLSRAPVDPPQDASIFYEGKPFRSC